MTQPTVVISGAGIAGPSLAFRLTRNGYRVIVVEIGPAPKKASDITATALVMKWMQRWPFRPIAAKLWFTTADSIDLPDYSFGAQRQ